MIADEVKSQLALENQEARRTRSEQDIDPGSSGIARLLERRPSACLCGWRQPRRHGRLRAGVRRQRRRCAAVENSASLRRNDGQSCGSLSKGHRVPDLTYRAGQLTDLQEMQNHMRETIDQGLQDLQSKQGTGGLPAAPPSAQAKPVEAAYAAVAPPPDPGDAAQVSQTDQQGDQAEKDVTAEAAAPAAAGGEASNAAAPSDASTQVASADTPAARGCAPVGRGRPNEGSGQGRTWRTHQGRRSWTQAIFYYNGMKVTFKDGKVSDVTIARSVTQCKCSQRGRKWSRCGVSVLAQFSCLAPRKPNHPSQSSLSLVVSGLTTSVRPLCKSICDRRKPSRAPEIDHAEFI